MFLANYADGLSDLPLNEYIDDFQAAQRVATLRRGAVRRRASTRCTPTPTAWSRAIEPVQRQRLSGSTAASSCCARRSSTTSSEGDELVEQPFQRLIDEASTVRRTSTRGFWQAMDTFKDKITFDRMEAQGNCPWMVWKEPAGQRPG